MFTADRKVLRRASLMTILIVFTFQILYAQRAITLNGYALSQEDSLCVSYTAITVKGKDIGTITNGEGYFSISAELSGSDTLVFTHVSYQTYKLSCRDFAGEKPKIILLKPRIFVLDEVVVKADEIKNVLEKAFDNSVTQIKSHLYLHTYYREFIKENQRYTKFADGLLNYSVDRKGKDLDVSLWVECSRSFSIPNKNENAIDWGLNSPLDVSKMPDLFLLNRAKTIIDNSEKYTFELKTIANEEDGTEITFKPKPANNTPLFIGRFILDKSKQYILLFQSKLEEDESKPTPIKNIILLKGQMTSLSSYVMFKLDNLNYSPLFCSIRFGMKVWNKKKLDETLEFYSDLQVKQSSPVPLFNTTNQKDYRKKTLFPNGNKYSTEFWKTNNTLQLTNEEIKIIESLK